MKAKIRKYKEGTQEYSMAWIWCPGCDGYHSMPIDGQGHPVWGFNGSEEKPTFTPSILVSGTKRITYEEAERIMKGEKIEPIPYVCHSFITDGMIQFLSDSTHSLSGQSVELPELKRAYKSIDIVEGESHD